MDTGGLYISIIRLCVDRHDRQAASVEAGGENRTGETVGANADRTRAHGDRPCGCEQPCLQESCEYCNGTSTYLLNF